FGLHLIHADALRRWSSRARAVDYLEKQIDHLDRLTYTLLETDAGDASLVASGEMAYLAWLYGQTALKLNGVVRQLIDNPTLFDREGWPNPGAAYAQGLKSKLLDERLVHRARASFCGPAELMPTRFAKDGPDKQLEPFVYPQLRKRLRWEQLKHGSQEELY